MRATQSISQRSHRAPPCAAHIGVAPKKSDRKDFINAKHNTTGRAMIGTAQAFTPQALTARPVRVEVDIHRGLPSFSTVGLPDTAARELRERVRAALVNCGFEFPLRRVVVNLAPASVRKVVPGLDLAVAVALLRASEQFELPDGDRVAMVGELALDGSLRSVPSVLPIAEAARDRGCEVLIVPEGNGPRRHLLARTSKLSRSLDSTSCTQSRAARGRRLRRSRLSRATIGPSLTWPTCAASLNCATRLR